MDGGPRQGRQSKPEKPKKSPSQSWFWNSSTVALIGLVGAVLAYGYSVYIQPKACWTDVEPKFAANVAIFGAGPAGLYTAWRLSDQLISGSSIHLYDPADYDFGEGRGTRQPAGRICTAYYKNDQNSSFVELGGMRYIKFNDTTASGHMLVTKMVELLQLPSRDFLTTPNPLFRLRGRNFYGQDINTTNPAPYNTPYNTRTPDYVMGVISNQLGVNTSLSRTQACDYYQSGFSTFTGNPVFPRGSPSDVGYWDYFQSSVGEEAYSYALNGGGYDSNLVNSHAGQAAVANSEFDPGNKFMTVSGGYSKMFKVMYQDIKRRAKARGVEFTLFPKYRLHSIWEDGNGKPLFRITHAPCRDDKHPSEVFTADSAFIAMPRQSIELVARATRYDSCIPRQRDFLNSNSVRDYRASVILQPSFKVAAFWDSPWWHKVPFPPTTNASANVYGPSLTDSPLRMVYEFGNNGQQQDPPVWGLLASYDDMRMTTFWRPMENYDRSGDTRQPLEGPKEPTKIFVNMVRTMLADLFFNNPDPNNVPEPKQTLYMDWSQEPFRAGYHAYKSLFDIADVQQRIRTPQILAGGLNPPTAFIVGEAYSNDQAWVEGAFATVESVLVEYFQLKPLVSVSQAQYPLVCQRQIFDVVVIGGGLIGLLAAIEAAKLGQKVVVIEQFGFLNEEGSSAADTRQFRQMYSEGYLAEAAAESYKLWRKLEVDAEVPEHTLLNTKQGYLFMGYDTNNTIEGDLPHMRENCKKYNQNCEFLSNTEIMDRFPFQNLPKEYAGIFHKESGLVDIEQTIRASLKLATKLGVVLRPRERVVGMKAPPTGSPKTSLFEVKTTRRLVQGTHLILTPGPYANTLFPLLHKDFILNQTIWELPYTLYPITNNSSAVNVPTWFAFDNQTTAQGQYKLYYGFPSDVTTDDKTKFAGFAKSIPDFLGPDSQPFSLPSQRRNHADLSVIQDTSEWTRVHLPFVDPRKVIRDHTCLMNFVNGDGGEYVLSYAPPFVPSNDRIVVYTAGWGAKFAPLWASMLAKMAIGKDMPKLWQSFLNHTSVNIPGVLNSTSSTTIPCDCRPKRLRHNNWYA